LGVDFSAHIYVGYSQKKGPPCTVSESLSTA
jgi:hypothetical protein